MAKSLQIFASDMLLLDHRSRLINMSIWRKEAIRKKKKDFLEKDEKRMKEKGNIENEKKK